MFSRCLVAVIAFGQVAEGLDEVGVFNLCIVLRAEQRRGSLSGGGLGGLDLGLGIAQVSQQVPPCFWSGGAFDTDFGKLLDEVMWGGSFEQPDDGAGDAVGMLDGVGPEDDVGGGGVLFSRAPVPLKPRCGRPGHRNKSERQ